MNAGEGIGTALVAALVSLVVSFAFRRWEQKRVRWLVTGEAHEAWTGGRAMGRLRATVVFHNVGDGDAFAVVSERSNGDAYESWQVLEAARVPGGAAVEVVMLIDPATWEQAWVELCWESSPTGRSTTSRSGRHRLAEVLWRIDGFPDTEHTERLRTELRRPLPAPRRRWRRKR